MSEAAPDDSAATLCRIEKSLVEVYAKLDRLFALVAKLPSSWHMPAVINATILLTATLVVLAGWLGTSGVP